MNFCQFEVSIRTGLEHIRPAAGKILNVAYYSISMEIGDVAPAFELPDTDLKMRTLDELKGDRTILSFFVAASSPVCERELCTFRDSWSEITDMGAKVIAISNDGPFANKAFAEKNGLNFPVLADYTSDTIRKYDVLMPDLLHIKGYNAAKRAIFILDKDGKIEYKWVSDNPLNEPDYEEIKNHLR